MVLQVSSLSIRDKVATLYQGASALTHYYSSWCPTEPMLDSSPSLPISEENKQVFRVKLRVDDLSLELVSELESVETELDLSGLVRLVWSLAVLGSFSESLIRAIQRRIQVLLNSSTSPMTSSETISLLYAEGIFFGSKGSIEIAFDNDTLNTLSPEMLVNALTAQTLAGKDKSQIVLIRKQLIARLIRGGSDVTSVRAVTALFAARAVMLSSIVTGDDMHHESSKILASFPDTKKLIPHSAWKYTFQLCLACHGVASKGVEINPIVQGVFPSDCMYIPTNTRSKKRILIELVRPSQMVRDIESGAVIGVDSYTRLSRSWLSSKGYVVIVITVTEWLHAGTEMGSQMRYVKRRIRNCLRQKRLYSGMERDHLEFQENDQSSESSGSDSSDMSY